MKTRVILFIISFLLSVFMISGQESQFVLINKSNARKHIIAAGQKVSVYLNMSSFVKGDLVLVDSHSISIGKDIIPLSEIYSIKALSKQSKAKGESITVIGGAFLLGGTVALISASQQKDDSFDITSGVYEATGIGLLAIGGIMTGAGIIKLAAGKNYKRNIWAYSIR